MNPDVIAEIAAALGIPSTFVVLLCEAGVVEASEQPLAEATVERVRVSWTLYEELGVNLEGIEVALHLLAVIERDRRHLTDRSD